MATVAEVMVEPPTSTRRQAGGLGLDLVNTVLVGRADEVIDLARPNVFR